MKVDTNLFESLCSSGGVSRGNVVHKRRSSLLVCELCSCQINNISAGYAL